MQSIEVKKGWYLVRANAKTNELTIEVDSDKGIRVIAFDPNLLPGRRLRSYFFCGSGTITLNQGNELLDVVPITTPSMHARVLYRIFKRANWSLAKKWLAALKSVFYQDIKLETFNRSIEPRKDLFAYPNQLTEKRHYPPLAVKQIHLDHDANADNIRSALEATPECDWFLLTFSKISLHPNTNAVVKMAVAQHPDAEWLYTHCIDPSGRCYIKPEFNLICFQHIDFIQPGLIWRRCALNRLLDSLPASSQVSSNTLYQWLLDQPRLDKKIHRIDELLVRTTTSMKHITRLPHRPGTLEPLPLVSIIIPTFNGLALLRQCIEGLQNRSLYQPIEIIVVDNNSDDPLVLEYFESLEKQGVTVLRYPHPFNYSAINNFAVEQSNGDYLCFLNNDVEVITEEWLDHMMQYAMQPFVGAVGARLLYPNGQIQHAGLIVGMGGAAGHYHRFSDNPVAPGFSGSVINSAVTTAVTAVTAACLVVKKSLFLEVDGFDSQNLAIAYNDVDLCLKLRAKGYTNVYCAAAQLSHHESISRGDDLAPERIMRYTKELRFFQKKWQTKRFVDPLFSKHLHLHLENQPTLSTDTAFSSEPQR